MTTSERPRSPLAMVVLALVAEQPMHPYRMQQLIEERGKDKVANVAQPYSVYQAIDRLRRSGLIAVRDTERAEGRPERTVYEITTLGQETLRRWLRTMLSTPETHFADFPAALATLPMLEPADVLAQLERRAETLAAGLHEIDEGPAGLPRLFLVEDEYRRAVLRAELDWVRALVEDLRSGRFTWSLEELRRIYLPDA